MTWRPSKSLRECSGINRRNTVSCFVIHKYGNGKQRLLVPADPCASSQITQSQRVHTKERRTLPCPIPSLSLDPNLFVRSPGPPLREAGCIGETEGVAGSGGTPRGQFGAAGGGGGRFMFFF